MAKRTSKRTHAQTKSGRNRSSQPLRARTTSQPTRLQSTRAQLTGSQLTRLHDVKTLPNASGQVDADECFLPLLLLFGLWGRSRALRNRGAYGGYGGWGGGPGGYGGYGGGPGGMMPYAGSGHWGGGGPWGSFWGGGRGYGAGMGSRGFGGWPFMF